MGIEPTPSAWKAEVLPLNYTRLARRPEPLAVQRRSRSTINIIALPAIIARIITEPRPPSGTHAPRFTRWWRGKDSNLRRHKPADLQSAPVGRLGTPPANEPRIFGLKAKHVNVPDGLNRWIGQQFRPVGPNGPAEPPKRPGESGGRASGQIGADQGHTPCYAHVPTGVLTERLAQ